MAATVSRDQQKLSPGRRVELFEFDATALGDSLYRWVPAKNEGGTVSWGGNVYSSLPIMASGFEVSGKGSLPTPTLTFSNIALLASTIINAIGDPLGAKVTRYVTFAQYLDDGATPDGTAFVTKDVYYVERKKNHNRTLVEFELAASMDQEGRQLPGRQVLRNYCPFRYRVWDATAGEFDYTNTDCPWVGLGGGDGPYFDENDQPVTDPALDKASKKLSCCQTRFGADGQDLPFGGFPAAGRIRRR